MKKMRDTILGILIIGVAVLFLYEKDVVPTKVGIMVDGEVERLDAPEEQATFVMGDVIDFGKHEAVVLSARYIEPEKDDSYYKGYVDGFILEIETEVKNLIDEDFSATDKYYTLTDNKGKEMDKYLTGLIGRTWNVDRAVFPGDDMKIKLHFEVPEKGTYELLYNPPFEDGSATIGIE